ncbi:MAG: hypothetical protein FWC43_14880 [Planctomycetaceae bacterium]|nr:hypothetical protein [Planctomycetaceae bacterium]
MNCYLAATRAAASVGGIGDFTQRSGSRLAIESTRGFQSLSRYNTSTR